MIQSSHSVEVRIKGQWVSVPVIIVNGNELTAKGKWVKIARIRGEEMMEKEVEDPEIYIAALKKDPDRILMSDIFSFTQKVSESRPKFPYPMEWESVAAIR